MLVDHHYPASDHDGSSCRPLTGPSIEGPVVGGVALVVGGALVTAVEGVSVDAWLLGLAVMTDSVNKQTSKINSPEIAVVQSVHVMTRNNYNYVL